MPSTLYPIKFSPILKQTPWGGERIIPFKHLDNTLAKVGESWEVSDVSGNVSIVNEGPFAGQPLTALIEKFKARLIGQKVYEKYGNHFPLLIKFIDARQDLSIQVHPNDDVAHECGYANGKTEMWYIIDAHPDASLLFGFNRKLTKDEFRLMAHDGTICEAIRKHPVKEGDCFFIRAGQVHAICSNIFLIEIQQSSDVTYRIFDYNRPGTDGKPRQLHISEAEKAIDFSLHTDEKAVSYSCEPNKRNEMVKCPYFTTSSYHLTAPMTIQLNDIDSFVILTAYKGRFTVNSDNNSETIVNAGETLLIPAETTSADITPLDSECKFLGVHID